MREALLQMNIWNNYNTEVLTSIVGGGAEQRSLSKNMSMLSVGRRGESISEIVRKNRRGIADVRARALVESKAGTRRNED